MSPMRTFAGAAALTIALGRVSLAALDPAKPPRPVPPGTHVLKVASHGLNAVNRDYDGQWQGIRLASDGNVYFASSTHSNRSGAGFFKYDPRAARLTVLCKDISTVCGEDPTKTTPQGKIHSDVVEMDGWLYFTTHVADEWADAPDRYPGSHLIGYELATGKFRDFGAFRSRCTGYSGIQVDPIRKKVYVYISLWGHKVSGRQDGSHLYCVDVATGAAKEVGMVGSGRSACFCLLVDAGGDCWFSMERGGATLFCAQAATGRVVRYPDALPARVDASRDARATNQDERWWFWGQQIPGTDTFLVSPRNGGKLWLFDPSLAPNWSKVFRPAGPFLGPTDLGITLAGDRVYYIQREGRQPGVKADDLHLMSASLDPQARPAVLDHGLVVDQDGRRPWRVHTLAADEAGRVYMVGDWYLKPGDKGTLRYNPPAGTFDEQIRGQFFAAGDVSKDLAPAAGRHPAPTPRQR